MVARTLAYCSSTVSSPFLTSFYFFTRVLEVPPLTRISAFCRILFFDDVLWWSFHLSLTWPLFSIGNRLCPYKVVFLLLPSVAFFFRTSLIRRPPLTPRTTFFPHPDLLNSPPTGKPSFRFRRTKLFFSSNFLPWTAFTALLAHDWTQSLTAAQLSPVCLS